MDRGEGEVLGGFQLGGVEREFRQTKQIRSTFLQTDITRLGFWVCIDIVLLLACRNRQLYISYLPGPKFRLLIQVLGLISGETTTNGTGWCSMGELLGCGRPEQQLSVCQVAGYYYEGLGAGQPST
jgi:hypothetical protein